MRPSILSIKRFDLAIIPKHDHPALRKNVVVTQGALNLIDEGYLRAQAEELMRKMGIFKDELGPCIGLLIGGDTRGFRLDSSAMLEVVRKVKSAAEKIGASILATTSRRTSAKVEGLLKAELANYPRCKLLVIANERNIPMAVGGILGLSEFAVVSPETISMISEAMNSKKYVLVFKAEGLKDKHKMFVKNCAGNNYVYLTERQDLDKRIEDIWLNKPKINPPSDNLLIKEAIGRIL
jgi:mitochondrial fission protein ELM1